MGQSLLCGLIGTGIQRSLSAALQQEEARHHRISLHYQLIDLDASSRGTRALPTVIEAARIMRFAGLNITYPCKQAVIPLLDELSPQAHAIGAVNTVVRADDRLIGHNTDGVGWAWGLRRALPMADLSRVVLKKASRAAALAIRLNEHLDGERASASTDLEAALSGATGLIHATPTGMASMPGMPLPEELLKPAMWVSDIVYVPLETPLLEAARRIGCDTADGGHMNVGQAVGAFKLFTGRDADAARMEAHFRRLAS
jgi:shikimate dehydrogenase